MAVTGSTQKYKLREVKLDGKGKSLLVHVDLPFPASQNKLFSEPANVSTAMEFEELQHIHVQMGIKIGLPMLKFIFTPN
jgi:hypothetical protein